MREYFEEETHFETYKGESNMSIGANCSILLALLLDLTYDPKAVPAVEKVSKFLASEWLNADKPVKDKWVSLSNRTVRGSVRDIDQICLECIRVLLHHAPCPSIHEINSMLGGR